MLIYIWMAAQIILEMFPISSSGHLQLLEVFYKKYADLDIPDFFKQRAVTLKTIYYFLHGPTLFVVLIYFFSQWYSLVFSIHGLNMRPILWVAIADFITLLLYLLLQRIKIPFSLGIGFIVTMMSLFYTAWWPGSKLLNWHYTDALIVGFAQGVALLPGISRLAFTCAVGCFLGFSLYDAFCISWLIQVPLMAAAFAQSIWKLWGTNKLKQLINMPLALIILISTAVSWMVLQIMIQAIHANLFFVIGWYMIIPLAICIALRL